MAKKQKRRAASTNRKPSQLSPEALAVQARQNLDANRFRDAIADFKQLVKVESRPEWQQGLADAYAGRARELTAKGMHKEAMVMWDNRAALGTEVSVSVDHMLMMMRAGRLESALEQLARSSDMAPEDQNRLRSAIAALALTQGAALTERLPADDPIRRQAPTASAALDAYCAGDDAALRAALSEIPFRSPYRDLAQILKALQLLPSSPIEAEKTLGRIGSDSGFAPLKQAAELALLPESTFLEQALRLSGSRMRLACTLKGWSDERIALLDELRHLGPHPKPDTLLSVMYKHRGQLGEAWTRQKTLRLLFPHYPTRLDWLKTLGAPRLTPFERWLIACWAAEEIENSWHIADSWSDLADELKHLAKKQAAGPVDKLRVALALRRTDQVTDILSAEPDAERAPSDVEQMALKQVEESLDWDPEDRRTYLRLIAFYRGRGRTKDARRILAAASERWPDDMGVLQTSMEVAIDSGAFKKASTIARRILEIDPINSGVRDALVNAHLAHASKQMLQRRSDLATKELGAAREWARSEHALEQLDIACGLNRLSTDADAGMAELGQIVERLGKGLDAQIAMALAADSVGHVPSSLLKALKLKSARVADKADLLAALGRLRRFLDRGGKISKRVESAINPPMAKGHWAQLERQDIESACETLRRAGLHQVRSKAARAALKRWRGAPIFELHAFEAKYPNGCHDPFNKDLMTLEWALDRARGDGDTRTALRIQGLIDRNVGPFGRGPSPFDLPPFDFDPEPMSGRGESPLEPFLEMIEDVGLEAAMDAFQMPKNLRKDLRKLAQEQGEDAVIELFDIMFNEMLSAGPLDGFLPLPPSPPPKGGKPKPRKKPDDEDPPIQTDPF
ncbi:hypothetical protein G3480_19250 [Thiorhodococcus mannitoliphagus]|uniref:Uncharacterized protein n=1 Tax=Thiorhodococcus mannitoliphagus TaxID=329406 RepID=A0A6P1DVP7_9GAMM|nr:hypothetical protein [Thiorhodococcus mannitoliphagus]NEX22417.1 hypothetical protein [Thiorhodococcus mannitoliphagus]